MRTRWKPLESPPRTLPPSIWSHLTFPQDSSQSRFQARPSPEHPPSRLYSGLGRGPRIAQLLVPGLTFQLTQCLQLLLAVLPCAFEALLRRPEARARPIAQYGEGPSSPSRSVHRYSQAPSRSPRPIRFRQRDTRRSRIRCTHTHTTRQPRSEPVEQVPALGGRERRSTPMALRMPQPQARPSASGRPANPGRPHHTRSDIRHLLPRTHHLMPASEPAPSTLAATADHDSQLANGKVVGMCYRKGKSEAVAWVFADP